MRLGALAIHTYSETSQGLEVQSSLCSRGGGLRSVGLQTLEAVGECSLGFFWGVKGFEGCGV